MSRGDGLSDRMLGDVARAEDLVQQALLRVLDHGGGENVVR
jgi:DNA-directed RNA polymerase specialized sigma24 family protein